MEKTDILDPLFASRRDLTRLIVDLTPASDEERDALDRLVEARDRVNATIRAVIDAQFRAVASPELVAATTALGAASKDLARLEKVISSVNKAIEIAGKVAELAGKAVALGV